MTDLVDPDSWESADVDESMKRLMIFSEKLEESASPSVPSASTASVSPVNNDEIRQVDQFLLEALEKPRERISILRMEQEIIKFICDPKRQQLEFEDLPTSYLRLAAHRLAQHYILQSVAMPENLLPNGVGSLIVLRKISQSNKLPSVRLMDIPVNFSQEQITDSVKVAIKRRSHKNSRNNSGANFKSSSKSSGAKSVEERKEEYNKARARIFSGSSTRETKEDSETNFAPYSYTPARSVRPSFDEDSEFNLPSDLSESSLVGNRLDGNGGIEQEVSRYRLSNRVAILRDREVDKKDPDYNRSYDRYMQRFNPGFGYNTMQYSMPPMYSPTSSYNTEFPHLGSTPRPQRSIDYQPQVMSQGPQHMHGHWSAASPSPIVYGQDHPERMMHPYNAGQTGACPSPVYMQNSSHCPSVPPRLVQYSNQHDYVHAFPQVPQQPHESNFRLARPR